MDFPDWSTEFDVELPFSNPRKPLGLSNELMELLWQNGEVVLHNQNHHKKPKHDPISKPRQVYNTKNQEQSTSKTDPCPSTLIQDHETISWIDCPIDESLDKEFCANFFSEIPLDSNDKPSSSSQIECEKFFNGSDLPPLPRFEPTGSTHQHQQRNLPNLDLKRQGYFCPIGEIRECSTIGSSHCGSNQVANDMDMSRGSSCGIGSRNLSVGVDKNFSQKISESTERGTLKQPFTSSSGGSGSSSLWKTYNLSDETNNRYKRKSREMEESECQSDATELESAAANKSSQKSGNARRSRVAEIHNQSERRRRDRINEKMKALQELIPYSSKTDKASMLDEAIEYMKSLQLQLQQLMWMGSGMTPMMIPGPQPYMARIGMGIGPPGLSQLQNIMRLPRFLIVDQAMTMPPNPNQPTITQNSVLNQINFQNQMQNSNFPEQFANYMGFQPIQNNSQAINMFNFAPHTPQKNQALGPPRDANGSIG